MCQSTVSSVFFMPRNRGKIFSQCLKVILKCYNWLNWHEFCCDMGSIAQKGIVNTLSALRCRDHHKSASNLKKQRKKVGCWRQASKYTYGELFWLSNWCGKTHLNCQWVYSKSLDLKVHNDRENKLNIDMHSFVSSYCRCNMIVSSSCFCEFPFTDRI